MSTKKQSCGRIAAFVAAAAALPASVFAASSIAIDSVTQRWPWNNMVDITYTVTDGANHAAGVYAGCEFTITVPGRGSFTVPGPTAETGGSGSKQHSFAWAAPSGVKATDCTVTATLFPTNAPANDYMVIDLATGAVTYERILYTQAESNFRYNTPEYKTTKMVLRKIPKWSEASTLPNYASALSALSGYPAGDDNITMNIDNEVSTSNEPNITGTNKRTYRTPDKDYYIGVFDVTESQYNLVTGVASPGTSTAPKTLRYQLFRSETATELSGLADNTARAAVLTNAIAAVTSDTGSFLQRLNYKTSLYFDYPTEVMHEIAARAGTTSVYIWGSDTTDGYADYVSCKIDDENGDNKVGTKAANAWGLYDMNGLGYDWCYGIVVSSRLYNIGPFSQVFLQNQDIFAPSTTRSTGTYDAEPAKGGGSYSETVDTEGFRASMRNFGLDASGTACCRVSCIVD